MWGNLLWVYCYYYRGANRMNKSFLDKVEAVVFAGGRGGAHSKELPDALKEEIAKPLLPVEGIPLIDYILRLLPNVGVYSTNVFLRDIPVSEKVRAHLEMNLRTVRMWKFPENMSMEAELRCLSESMTDKDKYKQYKINGNGATKDFLFVFSANSIYPRELLEDALNISERMFCEDSSLNAIMFYPKIMDYNKNGYAPALSMFKTSSINNVPIEQILTEELKDGRIIKANKFYGTYMHLAEKINAGIGGVKNVDSAHVVGHYDKPEDLGLIIDLIKSVKEQIAKGPKLESYGMES
jgi:hypothetical protein